MNKALYNQFIVLLISRLLQTNSSSVSRDTMKTIYFASIQRSGTYIANREKIKRDREKHNGVSNKVY
jgi:hypothetical protein